MPAPQVLQLKGSINELINAKADISANLKAVKYSSRYALGLYFGKTDALNSENWIAKFIDDHPIIRYVAIDHRRRNRPQSQASVTLHTNVTFGAENVDRDMEEIKILLEDEYKKLFPHWPQPEYVKCHRWRYSQVGGLVCSGRNFTRVPSLLRNKCTVPHIDTRKRHSYKPGATSNKRPVQICVF